MPDAAAGAEVGSPTMTPTVTGRHVEITPAIREMIAQKLAKLERLLQDNIVSLDVVLNKENRRLTAEVLLHARGDHRLHGFEEAESWTQAVAGAVDKVAHQAHTLKGKWDRHRRRTEVPSTDVDVS